MRISPPFLIRPVSPSVVPTPSGGAIETVLLVHGTFANQRRPEVPDWWCPGSTFCHSLDDILKAANSAARCWANLAGGQPFAWTGLNTESARRIAGGALNHELTALEADPRIRRYHLVAHSHGGNVVAQALRQLASPPLKLGAVVYLGTPYLDFHHRARFDIRWVSLPTYLALLGASVWAALRWPDGGVYTWSAAVAIAIASVAELVWTRRGATERSVGLYGSGRPRAFAFRHDEAISGLRRAQEAMNSPALFTGQFLNTTSVASYAVQPTPAPQPGVLSQLKDSGAYVAATYFQNNLDGPVASTPPILQRRAWPTAQVNETERVGDAGRTTLQMVDAATAGFPFKPIAVVVLWACVLAPRLVIAGMLLVPASVTLAMRAVSALFFKFVAPTVLRWLVPWMLRRAAFGADLGRFMRVSERPPGVLACEPISAALEEQAAALSLQYGSAIGGATFAAVAGDGNLSLKSHIEQALTNKSLAHSLYYQAPEIIEAIARYVMQPDAPPTGLDAELERFDATAQALARWTANSSTRP